VKHEQTLEQRAAEINARNAHAYPNEPPLVWPGHPLHCGICQQLCDCSTDPFAWESGGLVCRNCRQPYLGSWYSGNQKCRGGCARTDPFARPAGADR
jgi:hypothetical protein